MEIRYESPIGNIFMIPINPITPWQEYLLASTLISCLSIEELLWILAQQPLTIAQSPSLVIQSRGLALDPDICGALLRVLCMRDPTLSVKCSFQFYEFVEQK